MNDLPTLYAIAILIIFVAGFLSGIYVAKKEIE